MRADQRRTLASSSRDATGGARGNSHGHTRDRGALPDLDCPSLFARRFREIAAAVLDDQGGGDGLSEARVQLIRRFAASAALAEQLEARLAAATKSTSPSTRCFGTLARLAQVIGSGRTTRMSPRRWQITCPPTEWSEQNETAYQTCAHWHRSNQIYRAGSSNPETNAPFVLLDAEREFLKHAFATGADGRLLYPEQVYACPKKSGKTTFAAIFVIAMILLFGGRFAEAICAANDYEQSVGRVFAAIKKYECSPLLRAEPKITADKVTIRER